MAQYEARQRELHERYTGLIGKISFEEVNCLLAGLKEHARLRDEALVELAKIAGDPDDKPRHDDFNTQLDERRKAVVGALDTMLDRVQDKSFEAVRFRDQAVYEETRFFATLKALEPAKARDAQRKLTQDLDKLTTELKAKWAQISDTEKELLTRERYAALKMRQTLQKLVEDMVEGPLALASTVTNVVGSIEKLRGQVNNDYDTAVREALAKKGVGEEASNIATSLFRPGGLLAKGFYAGLTAINPLLGGGAALLGQLARKIQPSLDSAMRDATGELRGQLLGSIQVAFVFSETRKQANAYLRDNGYDKGKENFVRASESLSRWASEQLTAALKSEAEAWVKAASTGVTSFLELMRVIYSDMLSRFEGIFMNDLSERTVNALTDRPFFLDWEEGISRLDFDEKLRLMRTQLVTLEGDLNVAFERLKTFDHLPSEAQTLLQAQVLAIKESLTRPITESMREALAALDAARARSVRDSMQEMREMLAKQRDQVLRNP